MPVCRGEELEVQVGLTELGMAEALKDLLQRQSRV